MLYKETVSTVLLNNLQRLLSFHELNEFVLVGGTALSLQIGHRKSIDIDLFNPGTRKIVSCLIIKEIPCTVISNKIFNNES